MASAENHEEVDIGEFSLQSVEDRVRSQVRVAPEGIGSGPVDGIYPP
jgi:hypothetical protein